MTARSKRTALVPCAALLALALTAPAWAGGERCEKGDHAQATKAAHQGKATKTTKAEKVEAMKRAGWSGMEADKDDAGRYTVARVDPGSPAAQAGVRVGDRLVAYEGIALAAENKEALHAAKKGREVGSRVSYTLERDGVSREVSLTLVEVPDTVIARWLDDSEADQVAAAGGG